MTVGFTIHNGMFDLRLNGVGSRNFRRDLWERFGKICCKESINGPKLGGIVDFKFTRQYKTQRVGQQTTLAHLRIECLSRVFSSES